MGRLIGPKTWDRSVRIFGSRFGQSRHCYGLLWVFCDNLFNKLCFGFMRPVIGKKFGSKKVKPRLDKWAARGQPTTGFRVC